MKLFATLAIEIAARCNRTCVFCPVHEYTRPDEDMDNNLFCKAMDELHALQYSGRIEFYLYNEPTRDMDRLTTAVAMARAYVPRACLMIATNGDYLRGAENIVRLYSAGLNQLLINCYSPGLYAKRQPWLDILPPTISRTKSIYNNIGPRARTIQMLDKSNVQTFGTGLFKLMNRAGNVPQFMPAVQQPLQRMCTKPFRTLSINWQGQALLCCQDYYNQLHVGGLRDYTLVQLWNSPVLQTYRKHLLQRKRDLPMCNKCDCPAGSYVHNVPQPTGPYATVAAIQNRFTERKP